MSASTRQVTFVVSAVAALGGVLCLLTARRPDANISRLSTGPSEARPTAASPAASSVLKYLTPSLTPLLAESAATRSSESERLDPTAIDAAIIDFQAWIRNYAARTNAAERHSLIAEGLRLAAAHRRAIQQIIPEDPRWALERAVPMVMRQQLPTEILTQIEERISTRGLYGVFAVGPGGSEPPIRRIVEADGKRYQAHVYGRRVTQATTAHAFLNGIAVDSLLALDERPLRVLEPGEIPDTSQPVVETCPVSGKSTAVRRSDSLFPPITADTPAVEAGGVVHYLCSGGHIIEFEEQLTAREGGTGGPVNPSGPVPTTPSTGVKSCLYLRIAFPESRLEPQSEAAAYEMMRQVNDWFVDASYGNLYVLTTVAPLVLLPRTEAYYTGGGGNEYDLQADAIETAKAMGYDAGGYDLNIVAYTGGPGNFNGLANIGSAGAWLKNISPGVAVHELGHNFGLWHANLWDTGGRSVIGDGMHVEYGNGFDTMGPAVAGNLHFNAAYKSQLGWLTKELFHEIHQSGIYRLYAYDQPQLDPANRYAFKVRKDSARSYWGEFRQKYGDSNPGLRDGILLNWSPWSKSAGGTHLLDMTPGTPDGTTDAALTIGRTFSDVESGIHITPVGKGGTFPESIDVVVNLGTFPGNQAPTVTATTGQTSVGPGVPVTFTATATDPEGDPLAYFWDFGDGSFSNANSPGVTKSWGTAGEYVVRCVVSDMKGGTASHSVIVRVGSPVSFSIKGKITFGGQPLANVRVHNGAAGSNYRGAYTDSDGQYTMTGLSAGGVTLSAVRYGYSFAAAFSNPVTIGPNFIGADFAATLTPSVTMVATKPDTTEGANPGGFTLTRTGSTADALTVALLAPTGTASPVVDYQLSPNLLLQPTVTIPAGQASLDVILSAIADGNSEGPETVTIEVLPTASYTILGPESATVTIQDANTALPLVSIQVVDPDAGEAGGRATFVVSRTGPTNNPLTVNFSSSGTAANGSDYVDIGTSLVIPAGQPSTNLQIAPIQDAFIEGDEDVIINLSSSPNYLRAASAQSATAFIVDDDVPTLTISATDPTASEAGQDPATFVITRTGDTSAPLTVNYALAGTAQHGVDYAILPGVLTIPAGSSAGSITVVPINDDIGEPEQTVVIQIRGGTGYTVGNPGVATASILDNDVPVVTVGVGDGTAGEPAEPGQFIFTTSGSGGGNITIHYTVTGTATPGVDYVALAGTLSMGRNTAATVTVTPLDDVIPEDLETITVTIDSDPAYTRFLDKTATVNLLDNERNLVNVTASREYFNEWNGGVMKFLISRQGSIASALTVHYTISGTAVNGIDYQALSGSATIAAGQSFVTLAAPTINDALAEGTETATLTITPDAGYGIGIARATQYVIDGEEPPPLGEPPPPTPGEVPPWEVRFSNASGSGNENVGTVNIPVTLSAAATNTVTVEYAIAGGSAIGGIDYSFAAGVLTFAPGVTAKHIPLTIIDDSFDEPVQTAILQLKNAWGAALGTNGNTYTYTIVDNDNPPPATVGFAATASAASENVSPAKLLVSLSATQAIPVTVHYAPTGGTATGGGGDYTLAPGTLVFAPGETVKSIPIPIINDLLNEPAETVIVTLDSPAGALLNANTTHVCTLNDPAQTLPVITGQPQSQTVVAGSNVTLSVVATATPPPSFQWFFNSITVPGATSPMLTRSNFQAAAEGRYHLVATNLAGAATSQPAVLYLDAPLRFTDVLIDSNGFFHARLIGLARSNRVILASSDLTNWTSLSTNNNSIGIVSFTDTNSLGQRMRFYRAKVNP